MSSHDPEFHGDARETQMALRLAALGNETRLRVFRLLMKAGEPGLNVGEIQHHTGVPASTMAHHINALKQADLIRQIKNGREIRNVAHFATINALASYMMEECCVGFGDASSTISQTDRDT